MNMIQEKRQNRQERQASQERRIEDFFRDHSEKFIEMALRSDRVERPESADAYGKYSRHCGDTVEMFLKIESGRIEAVSFMIQGCINTHACANTVAELARGRSPEDAWRITADRVFAYLETLEPDHFHCAQLAVRSFQRALSGYRELEQSPWKKLYMNP